MTNPIVASKQDTLMGSFLLTDPDTYVNRRDAMNIMMSTSAGIRGDFPKDYSYHGHYIYSMIIPRGINMTGEKKGKMISKIEQGQITYGQFGKDHVGSSPGNLIHKIMNLYGGNVATRFLDDLQRMALRFNMIKGVSIGIGDLVISDEIHQSIASIIRTKILDIEYQITSFENNPNTMSKEVFETKIQSELQTVRDNYADMVLKAVFESKTNGLYVAIGSGSSKGDATKAAQLIGGIGQVVVESKRMRKSCNGRSLPFFFQADDGPQARGYTVGSYVSGLSPSEYFFDIAGGREGLISTAIKTAETGYIQRRLIKAMEDFSVQGDNTVRNANGRMIQILYGDSGVDTEKQIDVKLQIVHANNKKIMEHFVYSSDEIRELKKAGITEKYTEDFNNKLFNKLISSRDQLREAALHFDYPSAKVIQDNYMLPFDLPQIIINVVSTQGRVNEGKTNFNEMKLVDPYYVLEEIGKIIHNYEYMPIFMSKSTMNDPNSMKKRDNRDVMNLVKLALYDYLAPKKCTHSYKLSKDEFDSIIKTISLNCKLSRVNVGEAVGFLAAQSIGEPTTQMTLSAFHSAGTGKAAKMGLPRLKEIWGGTTNLKQSYMRIVMNNEFQNDEKMVKKIASSLKHTLFKHVIQSINIVYDPDPHAPLSLNKRDGMTSPFVTSNTSKTGCQSDIKGLPWVIRMIVSKEKMLEFNVNLLDLKYQFCNQWTNRFVESKAMKREEKAIVEKVITQCSILSNFDNSDTPIIHIRFDAINFNINSFIQFQEIVANRFKIKGFQNIDESNEIMEETTFVFDDQGNIVEKKEWVIYTDGVNIDDLQYVNGLDMNRVICNNHHMIFKKYGIEALRNVLIYEVQNIFMTGANTVNYQHFALLADAMTHPGYIVAINRHGINKLDTDPLSRASFEKTVDQLLSAAVFSETDFIRSVSSRIMTGRFVNIGTGHMDLLFDTDHMIQLSEEREEKEEVKIKTNSLIADLIKRKK
jgi:DNA-directed RNA polymerase II subunit RPB1